MKNIFKFIGLLIVLFIISYNNSFSQLTKKWEIYDTESVIYINNRSPITRNISYVYKNDIASIGYYDKYVDRYFINQDQELDTIRTKYCSWIVLRTSSLEENNEIIYFENSNTDDQWKSLSHPSENIIAVVGNSLTFLGYYNREKYKYHSLLVLSTDAGNSWERMVYDSNKIFCDISMCDSNNGIIYQKDTNNYFNFFQTSIYDSILITDDGWKTFKKDTLPIDANGKLYCISPLIYVVCCRNRESNQDYLSITTDGGNNWVNSSFLDFDVNSFKYINNNTFFVAGHENLTPFGNSIPKIVKSSDGGVTWIDCKLFLNEIKPDFGSIRGIDFYDSLNGISAGGDLIYRTKDAGITWEKEFLPYKNLDNSIDFYSIMDIAYPENTFSFGLLNSEFIIKCNNEEILTRPEFSLLKYKSYEQINDVKINWSTIAEANKYRIKIDSSLKDYLNFDFEHPLIDSIVIDTSITLDNLNYGHQYAGWIKALNDNNESDWNETRNLFMTVDNEGSLYPPYLIQPIQGYLANPPEITFIWTSVSNAENYTLNIFNYNNYEVLFNKIDIIDTTITVPGFLPSSFYEISMYAYNKDTLSGIIIYNLITAKVTTSFKDLPDFKNNELLVFPNPVGLIGKVKISSESEQNSIINIYNLLGIRIYKIETILRIGDNNIDLNTANYPAGIYIIESIISEEVKRGLFIKE